MICNNAIIRLARPKEEQDAKRRKTEAFNTPNLSTSIVPYSDVRACYLCLRSGLGSDVNVYNVSRGLRDFWKPSGA